MNVKFKDLYNAIKETELAYIRMGVDIDSILCGTPTCVLTEAQEKLLDSYMELANIDVDFCELDFSTLMDKMKECFGCITDNIEDLLPTPPEPDTVVNRCNGGTVVPLEHIKRFRIYEYTQNFPSVPSPIQVYVIPKDRLPYSFEPSVPQKSQEKYRVSWNSARDTLVVVCDHATAPESEGVPRYGFNIVKIVAEIADGYVTTYGKTEVMACKAYLMTSGVRWNAGFGLENAVDGDPSTYTSVDNSPPEIKVEFQFLA